MAIVARAHEQQAIEQLLDVTRSGRSAALVVVGEAGMGKSTLLEFAVARAAGMRVVRISGVASESEFGFAGLQRLTIPFMAGYEQLPAPQRQAIGSAFGLLAEASDDRFMVGLAALTLIGEASSEQPVLFVIDDAQWLDRESLDTLLFVARRLYAESVGMLFALRPLPGPELSFSGLPVLELDGFGEQAAIELLASLVDTAIDPAVAMRIRAETKGCPLAVVEIAARLTREQLSGADPLPDPLPIGSRLERHYLERVQLLPPTTQLLMLIAAAEPNADPMIVWEAAARLGIEPDAAGPAERDGLGTFHPTIEFRHPLVRSAVYGGASEADRRGVHATLGELTDPGIDPDGRIWHLASAAYGPDEAVASQLEQRATEARRRGRYSATAALLSRSAELTPDVGDKARRVVAAANAYQVAGAPRIAADLLDDVMPRLTDPVLLAQATRVQTGLSALSTPAKAPAALLRAARALEQLDTRLAREAYVDMMSAALVSLHLTLDCSIEEIARAALHAPPSPDPEPTAADLLLSGFATRIVDGHTAAAPMLRAACDALRDGDIPAGFPRWVAGFAGCLTSELMDVEAQHAIAARFERHEREHGALDSLRITIGTSAYCEMWAGRFDTAETMWDEARDISVALGDEAYQWEVMKMELHAWRGRGDETRAIVDLMLSDVAAEAGAGIAVNLALMSLTILELGTGAYDAALAAAWPLFERDAVPWGGRVLSEIVEAATRCGDQEKATQAFDRLIDRAAACGTPWADAVLARSRALMAGDEAAADDHYLNSIEIFEQTTIRTDLARSRLLRGEWLRRRNRRNDARIELRAAHDMFVEMGAAAFAERTRVELAATGERARKRDLGSVNQLTPQEIHIARLASGDETNRDIAAKLFLSPSTVDYHLRKVYQKLGIASRHHLAAALEESGAR